MVDDRHIPPEDDGIPEWLRDHPLADDDSQPEDAATPAEDDPFAFLKDVGGTPAPGIRDTQPMVPVSNAVRDPVPSSEVWAADDEEEEFTSAEDVRGITGMLPWMAGISRDSEPPKSDIPDWVGAAANLDEDRPPAENALPDWLDGAEPPSAEPEPEELPAEEAALPEWLAGSALEAEYRQEQAAAAADAVPPEDADQPAEALPDWVMAAEDLLNEPEEPPAELSYDEWLRQQEEATRAPSPEELLAEEVPDWFASLEEEGAAPGEPAAPAAEFVPDWYLGLEDSAPAQQPDWLQAGDFSVEALTAEPVIPERAPEPEVAPAEEPVPDWFAEVEAEDPLAVMSQRPVAPDEVPLTDTPEDWFAELEAEDALYAPPAAGPVTPEEAPDWFAAPAEEEALAAMGWQPAAPDEVPLTDTPENWFAELEAEDELYAPSAAGPEVLEPGAIPDWLDDVEPVPQEPAWRPDLSQPVSTDMVLEGAGEDDFMRLIEQELGERDVMDSLGVSGELPGLMPDDVEIDFEQLIREATLTPPPVAESAPPAATPAPALTTSEMPDWLAGAQIGGFSAARAALGVEETPLEELSDRLKALRARAEKAISAAPPAPQQPTAAAHLLAGIPDSLAPSVAVEVAGQREIALDARLDEAQQARVATLAVLLGLEDREVKLDEDGRPIPVDHAEEAVRIRDAATRARARSRRKPMRVVVTLALLAALVLPFFVDVSGLIGLPETTLDPAVHGTLDTAIEALEPGAMVLVGFEYGPTAAGELDALTNVLMTHMLVRGVRPVIISTNPAGVLQARNVMADLAQDAFILQSLGRPARPLAMPDDYVILPYLPGGIVGLRSLTATSTDTGALNRGLFLVDVAGDPTGLDVQFLQMAFDLILVLGERGEDVRQWVEQVGVPIKLPMAAAVSVSAEPVARPYLQSGQLIGLLAGYRDAYKYTGVLADALSVAPQEPDDGAVAAVAANPTVIGQAGLETLTPVPSATPSPAPTETAVPTETPTPSADDLTATAVATRMPTVAPSPTPRTFVTATPAPDSPPPGAEGSDRDARGRLTIIPLPEQPELETRWYSMVLGAFAASALIVLGAVVNIVRWLRRRREL